MERWTPPFEITNQIIDAVAEIAELTGYTDPKYMSRVFKEEVGMLPTEFRKMIH